MDKLKTILIVSLLLTLTASVVFADGNGTTEVEPENISVTLGYDVTFSIWLNATLDPDNPVSGWEVEEFNWTTGVFNVTAVSEGDLLSNEGSTGFMDGTISNATGKVEDIVCYTITGVNSTSDGSLCELTCQPKTVGVSPVNYTAELSFDGFPVTFTPSFGNITVHPFPPYGSTASYNTSSMIYLTWNRDSINGSDKVTVFADNDSYPASQDPAKLIYNGTASNFEDSGLDAGQTRYYTFWSWNDTAKLYSTLYQQQTNTTPQAGNDPVLSAESPTNDSSSNSMYPTLSITVNDPNGDHFNVSWSTNETAWTAYNSSCTNGTYTQIATWANASDTLYFWTVRVNDTNGNWTNATYHFTTASYSWGTWSEWWYFNYSNDPPTTLTATAYNKTQINITLGDGSTGVDSTIIVRNESGWSGTPSTPTNGTEIYNTSNKLMEYNNLNDDNTYDADWSAQTFTIGTNGPNIGFVPSRVRVKLLNAATTTTANITLVNQATGEPDNDTVLMSGSNSTSGTGWFEINFTTTTPLYAGQNYTLILTGNGVTDWYGNTSENYAGGEAYHYAVGDWYGPDGLDYMFEIYGDYIIDYPLPNGTQYCYSAWSWNSTEGEYSVSYVSDCATTQSDIMIENPYPPDTETDVDRAPTNISVDITGANLDIYFYFYNMTPQTDTWTLLQSWSSQSTDRFEVTSLTSIGYGTEFIWGNTTYYWTVNVTNGNIWQNESYSYTTEDIVNGQNARYDVSNNDYITVQDLSYAWAHRDGEAPYDNLYDVNSNNAITVQDLSFIWANRT